MSDELLYEVRDGVGTITFNRPQARNALTFAMYEGLAEICETAADKGPEEGGAKALVVCGAGDKAFAAGTDIAQFRDFKTPEDAISYEQRIDKVLGAVELCPLPTVAALAGACTGGGAGIAAACDLRIVSPLRLWSRRHRLVLPSDGRVYPNYSTISKLLAYEVDNRLSLTGIRLSRRRGEGIEFHQLRDYRDGDSLRAIDWKATSRMSRLIAREYQDERDQQIVFVLDAGRRMLAKDAELSHFDHTLNAMLLLCFVALRQGDAAGAMTVGASRTWLPPRKGAATLNGLLNHVYRIEPQPVEIDYLSAATELAVKQRRRSLIVMLTNVREEDTTDLLAATNLLRRRHVVIVASLRERALDDAVESPVTDFDDAVLQAATCPYLEARRESHRLLRANGVFVEDCLSTELPQAITNRYLAIKRAGLL